MRLAAPLESRLLSPERAAAYLGLGSRWAIYRLIARGELPAVKLAGKLRLDRADLDHLVDAHKVHAATPQPWDGVGARARLTALRPRCAQTVTRR